MHNKFSEAEIIKIDDATSITKLFDGKDFTFSVVIGEVAGTHPKVVNHASDRAYFILEGTLSVIVDDAVYLAEKHDLVTVPRESVHGLQGNAKYLIINSPPFDPSTEEPAS